MANISIQNLYKKYSIYLKYLNDRFQKLKWPMEFILWSAILLISVNLAWLRYTYE